MPIGYDDEPVQGPTVRHRSLSQSRRAAKSRKPNKPRVDTPLTHFQYLNPAQISAALRTERYR